MQETVYLPKYLEKQAHKFAKDYIEEVKGINPKASNYESEYKKAMNIFCKDSYEAMNGIVAGNPTTKKALSAFEAAVDLMKSIKQFAPNAEAALILEGRFKSAIFNIANIYLAYLSDVTIKRQSDKELSDFEFQKRHGVKEVDMARVREVNDYRYIRIALIASILAAIEPIFKINFDTLSSAVKKYTAKQVKDEDVFSENAPRIFADSFFGELRKIYSGLDLNKIIADTATKIS